MALYRVKNRELLVLDRIDMSEEHLYPLLVSSPEAVLSEEDDRIIFLGYRIPCERFEMDLLGIDSDGNLVIVEVKGAWESPRKIVGQLLEYASYVEDWGLEELKEVLMRKGIISSGEDLLSWLKTRFSEYYGEEPSINEQSINMNQKLVLFLPIRDSRIEKMVQYLRRRGLDIYYTVYSVYRDGETVYLVVNEVVGSSVSPLKKLQARETISVEEYVEILEKHGLRNIAEAVRKLYSEGRAYSKKHLGLILADGKITVSIGNPEEYPRAWIYVIDEDVIDKLVEVAYQLNLPVKEDKLKPHHAPIVFKGKEGLIQLDKIIKQFIQMLEEQPTYNK